MVYIQLWYGTFYMHRYKQFCRWKTVFEHTIPYLHIKPSSWRWTLSFETFWRHQKIKKLKYEFNKRAIRWFILCNYCILFNHSDKFSSRRRTKKAKVRLVGVTVRVENCVPPEKKLRKISLNPICSLNDPPVWRCLIIAVEVDAKLTETNEFFRCLKVVCRLQMIRSI
jgi:hypothetical protein